MLKENATKKLEELMANEEIFEKIHASDSDRKGYDILVENGLECSYEEFATELENCRQAMKEKGLISEDGELSLELLEAVSGGSARGKGILAAAGIVALCCGGGGIALACFALAILH